MCKIESYVYKFQSTLNHQPYDLVCRFIVLPDLGAASLKQMATGARVRLIADAKNPSEVTNIARNVRMRLTLETSRRGKNGQIATADDIKLLAVTPTYCV